MPEGASRRKLRFLADSSIVREYLWKYRSWIGIGLLALVIVDIIDVFPPLFIKYVVDIIVQKQPLIRLAWAALIYLGIAVVQGVCRYLWRMYLIRGSVFAGRDIRGNLVGHIFGLSSSFFDRTRLGDLMSLATNDVEAVRLSIGAGLLVFADALFYLLTVPVAMFILSPKLTLLACLPMPFIPWLVFRREKEVHRRFEKVQECFGRIAALVQENLNGIRVVKAFAREDGQINRIRGIGEEYVRLNLSLAEIQTALGPSMDFCMSLGMVILLFVAGKSMILDPSTAITLGTFVAFQRYIQKMVWPMSALGMAVNYYQKAVSSSYRIKGVLSTKTDVPEPALIVRPKKREGRIEIKDLWFRFPGTSDPALKGLTLTIEPGERIALVGSIGSGKSSLLALLPRLYPVDRGQLWVDGVDVNDWSIEELRREVGYVGQDIFLFSESVRENIALGIQTGGVYKDDPEEATRLAEVHEEILGLSEAYETRLGELGSNLSGGQKQRLTLARALALKPSILILDDALSSVDVQTEEKILKSLRVRTGRNTELIAAHRISTVKDADRIIVLEEGRIAQMGSHAQLVRTRLGHYWRFYEQQMFKEELENYGRNQRG